MLLMVNVDDVTGELVSHVINEVMTMGANNVHVVPAVTKKGRPEYLFYVDAEPDKVEDLGLYFARELGTIGMRLFESSHMAFKYRFQTVRVKWDDGSKKVYRTIRVKAILDKNGQIISAKADYDDLKNTLTDFKGFGLPHTLGFNAFKGMVEQTILGNIPLSQGHLSTMIAGGDENEKNIDSIG